MGWVDTHCHLFMAQESPHALLERATEVDWVVCPGVDVASSRVARDIAAALPDRVLSSVGLHPHEADRWNDQAEHIEAMAHEVAAIGECGLDYYRNLSPRESQLQAFRAQLGLADRTSKPVIVHCRDAFSDVFDELASFGLGERAVMHCWTGGPKWTKRFRELGVTFSFAGPVAFPNGDTVRLGAEQAPPERTMVETDTPYLTPPPHRGEPNEPRHVAHIGAALADVWGMDVAEVAAMTSHTAARVFGRP